jgi:hypothetical protein
MDNYQNYKNLGLIDSQITFPCTKCGKLIEETQVFAPETEYEQDMELCEKCFEEFLDFKRDTEEIL